MKYNYYDSNKIVIHGKAVPGQTLAWGETKMLTADKIQSVNTTDYWGNVLYENSGLQRYKFNGKELDLVHGLRLYDYGARMYDQILGCWTSVDPMAAKYYHIKNKCMKRLFVKTTFFVLLGICFLSCNKRDGKTITLMPSLYIKSYDVTYKSDSIIIKENSKEKKEKRM